jgi:hypothetical protein
MVRVVNLLAVRKPVSCPTPQCHSSRSFSLSAYRPALLTLPCPGSAPDRLPLVGERQKLSGHVRRQQQHDRRHHPQHQLEIGHGARRPTLNRRRRLVFVGVVLFLLSLLLEPGLHVVDDLLERLRRHRVWVIADQVDDGLR